ncbi:MAG TPA: iron-containing alcohol dehydrogenase [Bacillota bacterium]|nr:iron-containing alcohol dehydrogenase [Bacillota bacterium]
MENTHNFYMPQTNLVGVGAIKDLPTELMPYKLNKALIVTDKNMITLGYVEMVQKVLDALFIAYDVFDGVKHSNPTVSFVEDGLAYFPSKLNVLASDYDFIISVGGGTNHDCAKGIATVATNGGSIIDYEGWNKLTKPILPTICINTTICGAEVTMFAVITDNSRKVKMLMGSPMMVPTMSVNDPMFMTSMPKELTAGVGFDIITQTIETLVATEASPITDALALDCLKIAMQYLPRAYENGYDLEAREKMMYASLMTGMSFNNGGLGLVHSMSHQLGGFYNEYHGNFDAILLPYVLDFNSESVSEEIMLKIAHAMGIQAGSKLQALDRIISVLENLRADLDMPERLAEMGLEKDDIDELSQNALKDISSLVNPRQATVEDIMELFKAAM